jgi:WD40 repeat protein
VVTGGEDETVRLWDLTTRSAIGRPLLGHTGWVTSIAVTELDGRTIAVTGSEDHTLRIWDLTAAAAAV